MSKTMLAVVKPEAAPGADVRQMPLPEIGPDDVLVKVKVASICGTDLHIYEWDRWAQGRIHPPLIPGHDRTSKCYASHIHHQKQTQVHE